jgi:hypothetical protein
MSTPQCPLLLMLVLMLLILFKVAVLKFAKPLQGLLAPAPQLTNPEPP